MPVRPTVFNEADIYICESVYDETKRIVRELPREGIKKYNHSNAVTQDEIYFFRRIISPPKVDNIGLYFLILLGVEAWTAFGYWVNKFVYKFVIHLFYLFIYFFSIAQTCWLLVLWSYNYLLKFYYCDKIFFFSYKTPSIYF